MIKLLAAVMLSVLFSRSTEAFVFSFTNRGIEWGWEGKKHFKFSQTLEMCRAEDFNRARFSGVHGSAYFRWLQLEHNKINLNFSSGIGASLRYADFTNHFYDCIDFHPHLTALAIDPEFLFNERYSVFLRLPLLYYTYDNWPFYGPIRTGFISNIKIGISINFKGKKNNTVSESKL